MKTMISVHEALELVRAAVRPLIPIPTALLHAHGLVLSEDVFSSNTIPAFPQSSMDGYAFAFEEGRKNYRICGEIAAGSDYQLPLEPGTAIRIFTGAAVPEGADTVIMQEKTIVENGILRIQDLSVSKGDNVRAIGSEIRKGQKALTKGDILHPASIGFLAGIGIDSVRVYPRPRVSILVTGSELQDVGQELAYGQVYDSNSWILRACLERLHISELKILKSTDDPSQLRISLENALASSDLVLMAGGVSVGDYDYTAQVFDACKVSKIFHKVKQKPGKPILFGMKGDKVVFGLPGNPASVLTCFYTYVMPAIGMMMHQDFSMKKIMVPLAQHFTKSAGLTHFLKAVYQDHRVVLQRGQESYKLSSFAAANCLVALPEDSTTVAEGDPVEILLIP